MHVGSNTSNKRSTNLFVTMCMQINETHIQSQWKLSSFSYETDYHMCAFALFVIYPALVELSQLLQRHYIDGDQRSYFLCAVRLTAIKWVNRQSGIVIDMRDHIIGQLSGFIMKNAFNRNSLHYNGSNLHYEIATERWNVMLCVAHNLHDSSLSNRN